MAESPEKLLDRGAADEVLVTVSTYDRGQELDSYRRLICVVGLSGAAA